MLSSLYGPIILPYLCPSDVSSTELRWLPWSRDGPQSSGKSCAAASSSKEIPRTLSDMREDSTSCRFCTPIKHTPHTIASGSWSQLCRRPLTFGKTPQCSLKCLDALHFMLNSIVEAIGFQGFRRSWRNGVVEGLFEILKRRRAWLRRSQLNL